MSEIKVNKISPLTSTGTITLGGAGLVIGGTAANTTLIIATTQNPIAPPSGDMGIWITDGTVHSTYGYQATAPNLVGEYLGTVSNHPVGIMTNNATQLLITPEGNVGIGTTTPGLKFDVAGGIRAQLKMIAEEAFALAPTQLYTTQRTFTQVINTSGSNTANPVTANQVIAGQTWLLGTFSEVNAAPAMFKFVHNTHSGSNIQSDSYEWSRTYIADAPASSSNSLAWSDWVELPVTTSAVYTAARQFRFDVRAQYGSGGGGGNMQLRLRASTPSSAYDGPHYFTFTTTGMANYTRETVFNVATAPTTLPTGFHGRQAYEFPVSKGTYGFAGSTAGVFILNNGNVGIGTVAPAAALDVMGDIRATDNLTVASRAQILSTPHLLQVKASIVGASYIAAGFNSVLCLYGTDGLAAGSGAGIAFGGGWNAGDPNLLTAWAEVSGVRENATSGLYDGALVFKTRSVSTGVVEAMRITSTGLVGIGTTTPTAKLQTIASSNAARFGVNSVNTLTIGGNDGSPYAGIGYNINFNSGNGNQYFAVGADRTSLIRFNDGGFEFKGNTANGAVSGTPFALTEYMTILKSGVVNIPGTLSFNSGYGSSAVGYGCRAWVNFNGTGTITASSIRGSGNVSGITDNGVGDYTINFITAMPDSNYATTITQSYEANVGHGVGFFGAPNASAIGNYLSGSCRISFYFPTNSANTVDKLFATLAFFR